MLNFKIERDGFCFRAVNTETGARSSAFTSASQAGLLIRRLAGAAAERAAAEAFLASVRLSAA